MCAIGEIDTTACRGLHGGGDVEEEGDGAVEGDFVDEGAGGLGADVEVVFEADDGVDAGGQAVKVWNLGEEAGVDGDVAAEWRVEGADDWGGIGAWIGGWCGLDGEVLRVDERCAREQEDGEEGERRHDVELGMGGGMRVWMYWCFYMLKWSVTSCIHRMSGDGVRVDGLWYDASR